MWWCPSFSSSFLRLFLQDAQGYREFSFLLQPPFLSSFEERLGSFMKELPSLQPLTIFPPCAAPFSQGLLGRILHALETFLAMLTLWEPLTVSLAYPPFGQLFYIGLAVPHYLLEKNI